MKEDEEKKKKNKTLDQTSVHPLKSSSFLSSQLVVRKLQVYCKFWVYFLFNVTFFYLYFAEANVDLSIDAFCSRFPNPNPP